MAVGRGWAPWDGLCTAHSAQTLVHGHEVPGHERLPGRIRDRQSVGAVNHEAKKGLLGRGRCRPLPQAHTDALQCNAGDFLGVARSPPANGKTNRIYVLFLRLDEGVVD